ncbi:hypothetical protein RF11_07342 [Thelohanellus kitauei]|uniref:DH domain-containing protein n=1 Tax=Thelohanellus kitauei TaxID=669202 RepID=A0A0C2JK36_THEKT|nr:hypothetical protein RF11_07342 [Thelohanellus kitauei]
MTSEECKRQFERFQNEIVDFETIYLKDIIKFIDKYENPCKSMNICGSLERHNIIFGNIINLEAYSTKLIIYFNKFGVIQGFHRLTQTLCSFENYALNYIASKNYLKKKLKHDTKFRNFIEDQENDSYLDFNYYHQLPLNHIFQYRPLFEKIKPVTTDPDVLILLDEILVKLEHSISIIERKMKHSYNYEKMCHVQRNLSKSTTFNMFQPGNYVYDPRERRLLFCCTSLKGIFGFMHEKVFIFNDTFLVLSKKLRKYVIKLQLKLTDFDYSMSVIGKKQCIQGDKHVCGSIALITACNGETTHKIYFRCRFDADEAFNLLRQNAEKNKY